MPASPGLACRDTPANSAHAAMKPHIWHIHGKWRRYLAPPSRRTTSLPAASMVSIAQSNDRRGRIGPHPKCSNRSTTSESGGGVRAALTRRVLSARFPCAFVCSSTFSRRCAHVPTTANTFVFLHQSRLSAVDRPSLSLASSRHHLFRSLLPQSFTIRLHLPACHSSPLAWISLIIPKLYPLLSNAPSALPSAFQPARNCVAILMRPTYISNKLNHFLTLPARLKSFLIHPGPNQLAASSVPGSKASSD